MQWQSPQKIFITSSPTSTFPCLLIRGSIIQVVVYWLHCDTITLKDLKAGTVVIFYCGFLVESGDNFVLHTFGSPKKYRGSIIVWFFNRKTFKIGNTGMNVYSFFECRQLSRVFQEDKLNVLLKIPNDIIWIQKFALYLAIWTYFVNSIETL